jgi:glycolate oxidase iron-sulfur subunit
MSRLHVIDRARSYIERHYRRPWPDRTLRALLAFVLPRPRLFLAAIRLGRLVRVARSLFAPRLRAMLDLLPAQPRPDFVHAQVFAADRPSRGRYALLAGCAQQALDGSINAATIRLLRRHGCDVVVAPGSGCCGSLALHMGQEGAAAKWARRNVSAWWREIEADGLAGIVVNASGCGSTVKDYGHLLAHSDSERATRIARLTRDITEVLSAIGLCSPVITRAYRVAYHDPCSMQHVQHVAREPRNLLRQAGFQVVDVPESHFCCGSAGTYNLLQPGMAEALGQRKAEHISSTAADFVATGNIGCMMQLRRYLTMPIVHTVELLDWATGGPLPPALDGIKPPTPPIAEAVQITVGNDANAIW